MKGVQHFSGPYRRDRGEKQYRRALYVYWQRGAPYPSMLNFDACKRDAVTVTRATTVTPLQALTLLNDPVYVECAKMLGQRMLKDKDAIGRSRDLKKPEEDAKRLAYGFRLCTSRLPTENELEVLHKLLDDQRAHFKADIEAAKKLLAQTDQSVLEVMLNSGYNDLKSFRQLFKKSTGVTPKEYRDKFNIARLETGGRWNRRMSGAAYLD